MTEYEWLTTNSSRPLVKYLRDSVTERKLRLFGVACCRRISWSWVDEEASRNAVVLAEKFADSQATLTDLRTVEDAANALSRQLDGILAFANATSTIASDVFHSWHAIKVADTCLDVFQRVHWPEEHQWQSHILRDIFGNPFRPIALHPSWLTPTVTSLAQAVYDERHLPSGTFDNQRMAVLGDALEEAGCDSADVLDHCRGNGDHERGCWVVDAVLRKD